MLDEDLLLASGLLGILLRSDQLPGVLVARGGLAVLILPRASFKVVIPLGSSRALFIMLAASELEKLGGSIGLCRAVWEKNRGDGGDSVFFGKAAAAWKLSASNVCRGLSFGRVRFDGLSVEAGLFPCSSRGCFDAFDEVESATGGRPGGRPGFRNGGSRVVFEFEACTCCEALREKGG